MNISKLFRVSARRPKVLPEVYFGDGTVIVGCGKTRREQHKVIFRYHRYHGWRQGEKVILRIVSGHLRSAWTFAGQYPYEWVFKIEEKPNRSGGMSWSSYLKSLSKEEYRRYMVRENHKDKQKMIQDYGEDMAKYYRDLLCKYVGKRNEATVQKLRPVETDVEVKIEIGFFKKVIHYLREIL
ncbi:MAG: hypothetical protein WCT49_01630 [Candidatus Paceibacterota bacterium]|jgi:hypothetical protein|nr:hypothetical protein [Candidatus Paceibacterota bacterium]